MANYGKMISVFGTLNNAEDKHNEPTEHLRADKITVLYKGRVLWKQYIPQKHKRFGIKTCVLCDSKANMYNMTAYVNKDRIHVNAIFSGFLITLHKHTLTPVYIYF